MRIAELEGRWLEFSTLLPPEAPAGLAVVRVPSPDPSPNPNPNPTPSPTPSPSPNPNPNSNPNQAPASLAVGDASVGGMALFAAEVHLLLYALLLTTYH